jgi:hypothetical protein
MVALFFCSERWSTQAIHCLPAHKLNTHHLNSLLLTQPRDALLQLARRKGRIGSSLNLPSLD